VSTRYCTEGAVNHSHPESAHYIVQKLAENLGLLLPKQ
jgi:hypothetical protein